MLEELLTLNSDNIQILPVIKSLSSNTKIIVYDLITDWENISNIAEQMKMTVANISAVIKQMERAGIIHIKYEKGAHGVQKLAKRRYSKISFNF